MNIQYKKRLSYIKFACKNIYAYGIKNFVLKIIQNQLLLRNIKHTLYICI